MLVNNNNEKIKISLTKNFFELFVALILSCNFFDVKEPLELLEYLVEMVYSNDIPIKILYI